MIQFQLLFLSALIPPDIRCVACVRHASEPSCAGLKPWKWVWENYISKILSIRQVVKWEVWNYNLQLENVHLSWLSVSRVNCGYSSGGISDLQKEWKWYNVRVSLCCLCVKLVYRDSWQFLVEISSSAVVCVVLDYSTGTMEQWLCRNLGRNRCCTPIALISLRIIYRVRQNNREWCRTWRLATLKKTLAAPIIPEGGNDRKGSELREGWGQKLWALIQGASNQGLPGKEGIVRVNSRVSSYLTFQSPASALTGWTCMEVGRHRSSLILCIRVSLPKAWSRGEGKNVSPKGQISDVQQKQMAWARQVIWLLPKST